MPPGDALPRPEPAAGVEAYRAELEARLAFDPRTRENWERYLALNPRSGVVGVHSPLTTHHSPGYLPVKLDVENVSRCNFACTMCAVSKWPKRRRADDMPVEAFKALIDEQYGLVEIKLNGLGEALMQGDKYFEMIRYARERRIWVRMTTNASLLHVNDHYRKLIDSGVNEIDISVDGVDWKTFEGIRIGGSFDHVARNCATLNAYAAEQGRPAAKMWTLVQRKNAAALERHVDFAASHGFQHLVFSLQMHGWGDTALAERNRGEMVEIPEDRLWGLVHRGRKAGLGVKVSFWDVSDKFSTDHPSKLCPWPFERAVVTSDLRTVPCCMIGDPDKFEIGKGKTFNENWHGEEYRAFREAHLTGNVPEVCKGCYK